MKTKVFNFTEFRAYYLSEFELYDGEAFITFNIVGINLDRNEVQVAVSDRGKISVVTYDLITDKNGRIYFEYGDMYEDRAISVRETTRLQTFPEDYVVGESLTKAALEIGQDTEIIIAMAMSKKTLNSFDKRDLEELFASAKQQFLLYVINENQNVPPNFAKYYPLT